MPDGTYEGKVWKHTYAFGGKTFALFVNGGSETASFSETFSSPAAITKLLSEGGTASYASGSFALTLPPGGIGFFLLDTMPENALHRDDLVLHKLSDGAIWKGKTAVLYKEYNGALEILQFVENGDTVKLGTGMYVLKAFFWSSLLKPESAAIIYKTP